MTPFPRPAPLRIGSRSFAWGRRTYVMGILNLTADSFSGDGLGADVDAAVRQGARMAADGADLLDLGAASIRPGFTPVPPDEELHRVLPVLERLRTEVDLPLSIDTTQAAVARAALAAGAHLLNDVSGFHADPRMAAVVAAAGVPAVVMHNQRGRAHHDVIGDIRAGLEEAFIQAAAAGLPRERLIIDPGFGFGWAPAQNLAMLRRLGELRSLGRPILVGTSRKSTIGVVLDLPVEERLEGTAATVALAIAAGADMVRVHDVRAMTRVVRMTDAVVRGWPPPEADEMPPEAS